MIGMSNKTDKNQETYKNINHKNIYQQIKANQQVERLVKKEHMKCKVVIIIKKKDYRNINKKISMITIIIEKINIIKILYKNISKKPGREISIGKIYQLIEI